MQVTRALEYANRAMVFLAANPDEPQIVSKIARATAAPPNFLHQVLNSLARANLVVSHRGRTRGYALARPASEITLLDIFEVVEGPLGLTSCTMETNWCPREKGCTLASVWHSIQDSVVAHLKDASLDRLAQGTPAPEGCPLPVE